MQTRDIDYRDGAVNFRGYLAFDEKAAQRRPGVLVFHEGLGLGDFVMARARMLVELGYVALAADMFGERRQARNLQEVAKLVGDLRNQPETLRARGRAALATLAALPQVDANRMAAIGFCFGGSVVLELARDGADLKAVVSFHGVLTTKAPAVAGKTRAGVLVCTGADDPPAPGLAGDQLWRHAARLHQSGSGRLHPAERPLQRESGSPIMAGDAEFPCRGVRLNTDQDSD